MTGHCRVLAISILRTNKMSFPIHSQPAFLLHSRPFRDSSLLADFLTRDHGRISAIARGVRSSKSKTRALLQAFIPLQINLSGKSELKTLTQVEALGSMPPLKQKSLFAAMYMNELLVRLLHNQDGDAELFSLYEKCLHSLAYTQDIEPLLRNFELDLLELLGYGIDFSHLYELGDDDVARVSFLFHAEGGFEMAGSDKPDKYYPAGDLLKIAARNFQENSTLKIAKRLLREALAVHLGGRALASRTLFQTYRL